jgi:hypothetical protein
MELNRTPQQDQNIFDVWISLQKQRMNLSQFINSITHLLEQDHPVDINAVNEKGQTLLLLICGEWKVIISYTDLYDLIMLMFVRG